MNKLTTTLVLLALAGCRRDPQPVTVLSPATRPDLKLNAFLLSDNTLLPCKAFVTAGGQNDEFRLFTVLPGSANQLTHDEPPIEGFDGSFNVKMEAQPLLGSSASVLKMCAGPEPSDDPNHNWEILWKTWNRNGTEVTGGSGSRSLTALVKANGKLTVEFVDATGSPLPTPVTIERNGGGNFGASWNVTATGGAKFTNSGAVKTIAAQSGSFRMNRIVFSDGSNPIELAKQPETCAAFRICHDRNQHPCEVQTIPQACRGTVMNPVDPHEHNPPRQ